MKFLVVLWSFAVLQIAFAETEVNSSLGNSSYEESAPSLASTEVSQPELNLTQESSSPIVASPPVPTSTLMQNPLSAVESKPKVPAPASTESFPQTTLTPTPKSQPETKFAESPLYARVPYAPAIPQSPAYFAPPSIFPFPYAPNPYYYPFPMQPNYQQQQQLNTYPYGIPAGPIPQYYEPQQFAYPSIPSANGTQPVGYGLEYYNNELSAADPAATPTIINSNGETGTDLNSLPPQVKDFMNMIPQILSSQDSDQQQYPQPERKTTLHGLHKKLPKLSLPLHKKKQYRDHQQHPNNFQHVGFYQ